MKRTLSLFTTALALSCALFSTARAKEFISDIRATDTLELYTSEGCSSCPPADKWYTSLKQNDGLFKQFIPMAFHVDYWNYIGWEDRFSTEQYTARQTIHMLAGNTKQNYTPQVVLNGNEWRGHLNGSRQWDANDQKTGVLKAVLNDDKLHVSFAPASAQYFDNEQWALNVAYLGMGLKTDVKRGENEGRELHHDFVVLEHHKQDVDAQPQKWQMAVPAIPKAGQTQTAIAVWLSHPVTQKPLQAVGGYL
uniref:DUF1223 domain-containing protein n=1 Tax=uncultured Thiotrichaceae bacterium TaxID=298394 RepID=A0A6S6TPZ5_9GAMM|nr:MAG: hypothetical protein that often co-occurs with aconitase [uncultured Thiotrichaceae bacterium]